MAQAASAWALDGSTCLSAVLTSALPWLALAITWLALDSWVLTLDSAARWGSPALAASG